MGTYLKLVTVIDIATNNVVTTIPVGFNPIGIAVNPARTKVQAEYGSEDSVYDQNTNTSGKKPPNSPPTIPCGFNYLIATALIVSYIRKKST